MTTDKRILSASLALALALIPVATRAADSNAAQLEALREARAKLPRFAGQKGSGGSIYRQNLRTIDQLIRDLEAGKTVNPQEVDRLLR